MFDFKQYNLGENPQNLVIFLHGYNGNLEDHQYAVDWLNEYLQSAILLTPQAPEVCDKNPSKRQWFGMLKHDPEYRRINPAVSNEDIFAIYNFAGEQIDACAAQINDFITSQQQRLNIDDKNTFLIGFSQGAMLSIYCALSRSSSLGGVFVLSGLIAGEAKLAQKIHSRPPLYLFHGVNDLKVQYKTLTSTVDWLHCHNIEVQSKIYHDLAHRINEDEIKFIAAKIAESARK